MLTRRATPNAVMSAKCIPELGNATQHGAVDATIVWTTTAVLYLRDVEIVPIAPEYRGIVRLPVAVLNCSKNADAARRLKQFILSDRGKEVFLRHAYAVSVGRTDADGFCVGPGPTDRLMRWLVAAAAAVKDHSLPVNEAIVGPLVGEVFRQRATK